MELKINATDIRWWFWAITLVFIIAAVAGWGLGYYVVMGISAVQVIFFFMPLYHFQFDLSVRQAGVEQA